MNAISSTPRPQGIVYHHDLEQGSDEWLAARCGIPTASEMKLIVSPTLKPASNDKERAHLYELLAQLLTIAGTRRLFPSLHGVTSLRTAELQALVTELAERRHAERQAQRQGPLWDQVDRLAAMAGGGVR